MVVYLFRHGKAARQEPDGPRGLTSGGREEASLIAKHFKKKDLKVQTLWHSPKTRAKQTAEIFLEINGKGGVKVEERADIKPEGDAQAVYGEINTEKSDSLMLVTHLPFVAELASLFADDSPEAEMAFPTGGVAAFERKGKNWKWLWSLDPSTLK